MSIYKKLNVIGAPKCSTRANQYNILMGDIVCYIDKYGGSNYCRVDSISSNTLKVTELQYFNYVYAQNEFRIDPHYKKENYSHKGFLNYDGRSARKIMIVDRQQLE